MQGGFVRLEDFLVYRIARELSKDAWKMYASMPWHTKKIIGDQFITAVDSFGANIAEGFGRFHYLDKIKFYYNARGSLVEAKHWATIIQERQLATTEDTKNFLFKLNNAHFQHNTFIKTSYQNKKKSQK